MPSLSNNERAKGYSHALRFNYADLATTGFLSTIGAANQKQVGSLPPGGIIDTAVLYQVTDPAGATDLTIDFGTTAGDPDELIDAGDVDAATQVIWNTGDALTSNTLNGYVNNTTAALPLYMEFNGTHASLSAGEWVLCWNQKDIPTFG